MKTRFLDQKIIYDGSQLHSLFSYLNFELMGDSMVAFRGPCRVSPEKMVDGEDLLAHAQICGDEMLHFIAEFFSWDLIRTVFAQRLLSSLALEEILRLKPERSGEMHRSGDDIYVGEKKLSISIATLSPVSGLIHFAINITTGGTPVPTSSLEELGIEPAPFAKSLMDRFSQEVESSLQAATKVRWVK